jgi:molybdate transport system permease protein
MDWQAVGLSLRLSACTTLVLVVLGLPLAYWIANTRWRGKFLIEAVVALPIVLPPTVLGFYVLMAIGPHSPLGRFYESLFGHRLLFTFQGLLVASVLYSLPFAVQPFTSAFATVDRRMIEGRGVWGREARDLFPVALRWPGRVSRHGVKFAHDRRIRRR